MSAPIALSISEKDCLLALSFWQRCSTDIISSAVFSLAPSYVMDRAAFRLQGEKKTFSSQSASSRYISSAKLLHA
ncbi:MAG: hypothetical protein LUQ59_01055 [Methanothrix sp.]|nr:hypothetical protein [Methanothrix sp.]